LYRESVRVVAAKRPRYFLAENVKGLMTLEGGSYFRNVLEAFRAEGYEVSHALLNAADYGVPQRRLRVFILGVRVGDTAPRLWPPSPTHADRRSAAKRGLEPWIGVADALADIPEPDEPHELLNHEASKYKLRFNGYLGHRAINPTEPCPTLTARGDDRGGVVIHHHPSNRRRLTAREAAVIQSFPLDFRFHGTKTSVYRQIANAVPPRIALAIAATIEDPRLQRMDASLVA
jgi:DNA (cytosine-5)-methyltransferase 1